MQERNSQVVLMDHIYQRANSVLIWLGGLVMVDGKDIWSILPLLEAAQMRLKRTELPFRRTPGWFKPVLINGLTVNRDLLDKK